MEVLVDYFKYKEEWYGARPELVCEGDREGCRGCHFDARSPTVCPEVMEAYGRDCHGVIFFEIKYPDDRDAYQEGVAA
jgi:hypothetical protein